MSLYSKATVFASIKHQFQRRKNGKDIPYINHPLEVAYILSKAGVQNDKILAAAVLHDTIQDTQTTLQELDKEFGSEVANIVLECSDDKSLGKSQRKIHQIQKAKKVSKQAKLVKIADKISNNRGLLVGAPEKWTPERTQGYFIWSQAVCNQLKGQNEYLDEQISRIFNESGINKLDQEKKEILLKKYYELLEGKTD